MKKIILTLALIVLSGVVTVAAAQNPNLLDTLEMEVRFRANKTVLDMSYRNNQRKVDSFVSQIKNMTKYQGYQIREVNIYGSSSIDGRSNFNIELREQRVQSVANYLRETLSLSEDKIHGYYEQEHWNAMIEEVESSEMPYREEVLNILKNTPEWIRDSSGVIVDSRKLQLQNLDEEKAWWYMSQHTFPKLRKVKVQVVLIKVKDAMIQAEPQKKMKVVTKAASVVDTIRTQVVDTLKIQIVDTIRVVNYDTIYVKKEVEVPVEAAERPAISYPSPDRYPVFAFRTNLLAPLFNIGIELPLSNAWSMEAEVYYPQLGHKDDYSLGFDFFYAGGGFRFWIGEDHNSLPKNRMYRLTGHSIGIYGGGGMYDFVKDTDGLVGVFASGGFDYLCSLPVANGKLFIEFSISAGFIVSDVASYKAKNIAGSYILEEQAPERFTYFGPTKAAISLVVPIYKRK